MIDKPVPCQSQRSLFSKRPTLPQSLSIPWTGPRHARILEPLRIAAALTPSCLQLVHLGQKPHHDLTYQEISMLVLFSWLPQTPGTCDPFCSRASLLELFRAPVGVLTPQASRIAVPTSKFSLDLRFHGQKGQVGLPQSQTFPCSRKPASRDTSAMAGLLSSRLGQPHYQCLALLGSQCWPWHIVPAIFVLIVVSRRCALLLVSFSWFSEYPFLPLSFLGVVSSLSYPPPSWARLA
jgi:hypothetical protein